MLPRNLLSAALFSTCSLLATALSAAENAAALTGCAAKRQALNAQIEQAKANGTSAQQAGLEKALSKVKAECTDDSLKKSREEKVLEAQHEVSQRENDLRKAMGKGDAEKINTRKDQLAEARKELQQAQDQLGR